MKLGASHKLVILVLFACCGAIMTPRLLSPEFGLLDDGTTLLIADAYLHDPFGVVHIEADRGRFRPVYWLYYIRQYPLWGTSPLGYFLVQASALGLTTVLIAQTIADATGSSLSALFGGAAFLIAGPVWEAYYTLSKPEPPLVLFVAAATFCLFRAIRHDAWSTYLAGFAVLTGLAYFTKETALGLLPLSIVFALVARSKTSAHRTLLVCCAINVLWFSVFIAARWLTNTSAIAQGTDSANYRLDAAQLFASAADDLAWLARDFAFAAPLICFGIVIAIRRKPPAAANLLMTYGGLLFAGWIGIMLPWASSFEYYLLPASIGIALMVGASVFLLRYELTSRKLQTIGLSVTAVIACLPLITGYTTARLQLAIDQANSRLVQNLAASAPQGGTVVADFENNSEYVFELGMQLRELYGRSDIRVVGLDLVPERLESGQFVVIQQLENRPLIMPRIATGASLPVGNQGESSSVWTTDSRVRMTAVNAQEPLCRIERQIGLETGSICRDPVLLLDNREFVYGWQIGRIQ